MMLRAIGLYVISLAAWTAVMYPIVLWLVVGP